MKKLFITVCMLVIISGCSSLSAYQENNIYDKIERISTAVNKNCFQTKKICKIENYTFHKSHNLVFSSNDDDLIIVFNHRLIQYSTKKNFSEAFFYEQYIDEKSKDFELISNHNEIIEQIVDDVEKHL